MVGTRPTSKGSEKKSSKAHIQHNCNNNSMGIPSTDGCAPASQDVSQWFDFSAEYLPRTIEKEMKAQKRQKPLEPPIEKLPPAQLNGNSSDAETDDNEPTEQIPDNPTPNQQETTLPATNTVENTEPQIEEGDEQHGTKLAQFVDSLSNSRNNPEMRWKQQQQSLDWRWKWLQLKKEECNHLLQQVQNKEPQEETTVNEVHSCVPANRRIPPGANSLGMHAISRVHPTTAIDVAPCDMNEMKSSKRHRNLSFSVPGQKNGIAKSRDRTNRKRLRTPGGSSLRESTASTSGSHKRKASDFDIDNVVVPLNSMSSAFKIRVIEYKQIQTPKWTLLSDYDYLPSKDKIIEDTASSDEDTSDESYLRRHIPKEKAEHIRFMGPVKNEKKKKKKEEKDENEKDFMDKVDSPEASSHLSCVLKSLETCPKEPVIITKEDLDGIDWGGYSWSDWEEPEPEAKINQLSSSIQSSKYSSDYIYNLDDEDFGEEEMEVEQKSFSSGDHTESAMPDRFFVTSATNIDMLTTPLRTPKTPGSSLRNSSRRVPKKPNNLRNSVSRSLLQSPVHSAQPVHPSIRRSNPSFLESLPGNRPRNTEIDNRKSIDALKKGLQAWKKDILNAYDKWEEVADSTALAIPTHPMVWSAERKNNVIVLHKK